MPPLGRVRLVASDTTVAPGERFEVSVWLENFTGPFGGLEGFQVRLTYDPNSAKLIESESGWATSAVFPEAVRPMTYAKRIDGQKGVLEWAQSLPPQETHGLFSGYAKLGTFVFEAASGDGVTFEQEKSIIILPKNAGKNILHEANTLTIAYRGVDGSKTQPEDKRYRVGEQPKEQDRPHPSATSTEVLGQFRDQDALKRVSWAHDGLAKLVRRGVLRGTPDGDIRPNKAMTRAEFSVMMVKALGLEMKQEKQATFTDLPRGHWAFDYAETAVAEGLIAGEEKDGKRHFAPDRPITRAEMAAIMVKALHRTGLSFHPADERVFGDVPDGFWAKPAILELHASGMVQGKGADRFAPLDPATRAELAVVMSRLSGLSEGR